jgi:DNA-binding MarR family transcriptional regulator
MAGSGRVLADALRYAAGGLQVFPLLPSRLPIGLCSACRPPESCPGKGDCRCGITTCHGFYAATTDPVVIRDWFTAHPERQLGLRTGATSNVVVLDVDLDKDGLNSLIALQRLGMDITGCQVQLSGSGESFHLFFRHPGGYVPNSQGALGPGLDVRGDGGYVVVAPSVHPATGACYELLGGLCPEELPAWVGPAQDAHHRAQPVDGRTRPDALLTLLSADAGKPMCDGSRRGLDAFRDALAEGPRHAATLGPLLQLLRLRQVGHCGVPEALLAAREAFVQEVAPDRGQEAAAAEFDRALAGASRRLASPREPKEFSVCECQIRELHRVVESGTLLSRGAGRNNEQKIMRYLLLRAQQHRVLAISESQRQIAQAIDVHQPTVSNVLTRLEGKGLLTRQPAKALDLSDTYLLTPPHLLKALSPEEPTSAGSSGDKPMRAYVHPLFGAGGLGPGPADTFAQLDEFTRRLGRGRLVRLRKGTADQAPEDAYTGIRQVPRPAGHGRGLTVEELAKRRGRSLSTVRRHLQKLKKDGLVFEVDGRWWRVRFNPDAVVRELNITDTAERKRIEYERQRRQRREALGRLHSERDQSVVRQESLDGTVTSVCTRTGEVLTWHPQHDPSDPPPSAGRESA